MNIDVKDSSDGQSALKCEFPVNYKYSGEAFASDELRIFVRQEILSKIDDYLASDKNNELGGVLVGEVCRNESGESFTKIDNLIIAKHTNSSISRLTFTHETWDYINGILESDFPGRKILGWFHSHPGHTVFLSNYDVFIHENFFSAYYMTAYVYDPTINERGFFIWKDGKIKLSSGYYIYDIVKMDEDDISVSRSPAENKLSIETDDLSLLSGTSKKNGNYITIGLLVFALALLLFNLYNIYDFKQKALLKDVYLKDLSELKNENQLLTERLNEYILETELRKNSGKTQVTSVNDHSEPIKEVSSGEKPPVTSNTVSSNDNQKQPERNTQNESGNVSVTKYKVKSGDTLEKIAMQFYKNRSGIDLIMKQNKIANKADIKIGQELDLPNVSQ